MAATGRFIHSSIHTGFSTAATSSYVAAQRHPLPLNSDQTMVNGNVRGVAILGALYVHVNTIAAGATTLTLRLSLDFAGDQPWIGDTTATISTGVTTAASGAVTIKIDVPFIKPANDILFCHWKTDIGTCTVDAIHLTWTE
jgi:TRAP-type mannitol/chloroaromatic compound transport system substrate-binding protein